MTTIRDQVREFHEAAKAPILEKPEVAPEDRMRLRLSLVTEEFSEFLESALGAEAVKPLKDKLKALISDAPLQVDLVKLVDAMADMDYVVEGTRLECGVDGGPVAEEVHRSNMAKFGPGSRRREDGKVLKPPDWKPPDIKGVLRAQGLDSSD